MGVKNIIKAYRFTFSSPPQRRPSSSNMEWVLVFLYVFSNIKLTNETESFVNGGLGQVSIIWNQMPLRPLRQNEPRKVSDVLLPEELIRTISVKK